MVLVIVASVYSLLGIAALVIGFVIPWDVPLSAVYAILVGVPWTYLFVSLADRVAEDRSVYINIALVTGAIALNGGHLWWWASTRIKEPAMNKGVGKPMAGAVWILLGGLFLNFFTPAANASDGQDPDALFARAANNGSVGLAKKTRVVDARPAVTGEVIVTVISGEGEETRSKPAAAGDMVVRNRCPATGNEQYLVKASKFAQRYGEPIGPESADGWRPFRPRGTEMLFVVVSADDGTFTFTAPWGEPMVARPGDAMVRNPADPKDTYRVAAASFECTYEIFKPAEPAK